MAANQFDRDVASMRRNIEAVIQHPVHAARADHFRHVLKDNDSCFLRGDAVRFGVRNNGRIMHIPWRAFVYYAVRGVLPDHDFGPTSCGTPGCVNPAHQTRRVVPDTVVPGFRFVESVVAAE